MVFEDNECFKAVERERDRKDLFEDFIHELDKKVILTNYLVYKILMSWGCTNFLCVASWYSGNIVSFLSGYMTLVLLH